MTLCLPLLLAGFASTPGLDDSSVSGDESSDHSTTSPRITANVDVTPVAELSSEERRAVSIAATHLLRHVHHAHRLIEESPGSESEGVKGSGPHEALQHIEKGIRLVKILEQTMPKHHMKTLITARDLTYEDEEDVSDHMVSIYDELSRIDVVRPMLRHARADETADSKTVDANDDSAEESAGNPVQAAPPVVAVDALEHTSLKLDVAWTGSRLELAKRKLAQGRYREARAALASIRSGLEFRLHEVDLPLARAADNLKLAEAEFHRGLTGAARAALLEASDALKEYEQLAGNHRSEQAQKLHQEIDNLVAQVDANPAEAKEMVSNWWDKVVEWLRH